MLYMYGKHKSIQILLK